MKLNHKIINNRQCGVALVIVLALVVLLTGLIVAFFSRAMLSRQVANSSANEAKADLLAKSAMDVIVGDLKQEMADGSDVATVDGHNAYRPKTAANMLPQRSGNPSGSPDPIPNLIRRSVRSDAMAAPGVKSRASAINSSTDASLNGRIVTPARWNSHYLISRFDKANAIDSTPDGSANFTAPDWVLVTRGGPEVLTGIGSGASALNNPAPANQRYVVGRYAYAIYDQGRLLDMNVAGSPSGLTSTQVGEKGGLALADLTLLPIVKNPTAALSDYLTQAQIDQLVGWRNYYTAQPSGSFGNFTFNAASATSWLTKFVRENDSGFLKVSGGTGSQTDQAFLGRQELIKLSRALGINQNALQYLGTFSRQYNAPSWEPGFNANSMGGSNDGVNISTGAVIGGAYAYKNNGESPTSINRRFLTARVTKPFTRLDGTIALVGEPLVKNRFDLGKLDLIRHDGSLPSGVTDTDVYNYFGLKRSASTGAWIYDHGAPGSGKRIMTLDEVAGVGREPDFFELLQAGILQGGLGLTSGDASQKGNANLGGEFARLGTSGAKTSLVRSDADGLVYAQEKYQVIQIGANMIDQADADGFPTEVLLNGEPFYGVENIPYINAVGQTALRPPQGGAISPNAYQAYVHQWLTFSLWNPHQNAATSATNGPVNFRVFTRKGMFYPSVQNTPTIAHTPGSPPYELGKDFSVENAWVAFNMADYPGKFSEPTTIKYEGSTASDNGRVETAAGWKRAGIYMGWSYSPEVKEKVPACAPLAADASKFVPAPYNAAKLTFSIPLTLELQYQDPVTSSWHTYHELRGLITSDGRGDPYMEPADPAWNDPEATWVNASRGPLQIDQEGRVMAFLDPRAVRLNLPIRKNLRLAENYSANMVDTLADAGSHFPLASNLWSSWVNNTGVTSYYTDRDFIRRIGDSAGWANADPQLTGAAAKRPFVLNRPFRSVAELGYVFRDDPWKSLNLISANSADAALLDIFCVGAEPAVKEPSPSVVAGKVNINSASVAVLNAMVMGVLRDYQLNDPAKANTTVSRSDAQVLTADIVAKVKSLGAVTTVTDLLQIFPQDTSSNTKYPGNKIQREALLRAIVDGVDTRTWNLLIDIIAQSGKYGANAKNISEFTVEAEKRYWLHIAIDRFTGEIVGQQLEQITE